MSKKNKLVFLALLFNLRDTGGHLGRQRRLVAIITLFCRSVGSPAVPCSLRENPLTHPFSTQLGEFNRALYHGVLSVDLLGGKATEN